MKTASYNQKYYAANRERLVARAKEYAKANRAKVLAGKRAYYLKMRDDPEFRKTRRDVLARARRANPTKFANSTRSRRSEHHRIGSLHTTRLCAVMHGRIPNSKKVVQETGLTSQTLRWHMESQFSPEMSWSNYGSFWSVDHIRPKQSFNLARVADQVECFHWTNLRPLPNSENKVTRTK